MRSRRGLPPSWLFPLASLPLAGCLSLDAGLRPPNLGTEVAEAPAGVAGAVGRLAASLRGPPGAPSAPRILEEELAQWAEPAPLAEYNASRPADNKTDWHLWPMHIVDQIVGRTKRTTAKTEEAEEAEKAEDAEETESSAAINRSWARWHGPNATLPSPEDIQRWAASVVPIHPWRGANESNIMMNTSGFVAGPNESQLARDIYNQTANTANWWPTETWDSWLPWASSKDSIKNCSFIFGLPKFTWAVLCDVLALALVLLCIPLLLTCSRRRPPGAPLFDCHCGGPGHGEDGYKGAPWMPNN